MTKKALVVVLVVLLAFAGITSCSKDSSSEPSEKATSVSATSASTTSVKSEKKKPSKPKVITADDVSSIRRGQKITVTGELSTAAPNSRVDAINDYTDIVLNLYASNGTQYKVYAFAVKVDTDDIRNSYPDIDMGTLLNSGNTKYRMTLTGTVSAFKSGDESGKLLGLELEDVSIVDATPI